MVPEEQEERLIQTSTDAVLSSMSECDKPSSWNEREAIARVVSVSELEACGRRLRDGNLVAFPTETVYGLGCNALDTSAISKVFEAKERPLTDPLITHVTEHQTAYDLWEHGNTGVDQDDSSSASTDGIDLERRALRAICERFWPGPLTVVAKAKPHVPGLLMANTGFVACRSPKHVTARALIEAAGVPIAAPSANKFGHVSPTRSHHVWDDLKYEDVWIVQENTKMADNNVECEVACEVGVESSVVKIEMVPPENGTDSMKSGGKVTLLRQGAVSFEDIERCLEEAGLTNAFTVISQTKKAEKDTIAQVAPGQSIRHYSPDIPSFILDASRCPALHPGGQNEQVSDEEIEVLSKCVLIDFGGRLKPWEEYAIAYKDLSPTADSSVASQRVFEVLRWAEGVDGANKIIFPEIITATVVTAGASDREQQRPIGGDALTLALKDRLTRAASGVVIDSLLSK